MIDSAGSDSVPAPAPSPSSATTLSTFDGTAPNGIWSLYVIDDASGDRGTIAGGWCLTVTAQAATTTPYLDLNPSSVGQSVTFTATVTSGRRSVATGTVPFTDGGSPLGRPRAGRRGRHGDAHDVVARRRVAPGLRGLLRHGDLRPQLRRPRPSRRQGSDRDCADLDANPSTVGESVTFTATVTS